MKKIISMVMSFMMIFSCLTFSGSAKDYTDSADITYDKAIDVVSVLNIVDGYTDGTFKPNTTLTRGQAAKIISNMILGPTTANALTADTAPFSDVPADAWYAGYVAYCAQQGIINGYADGTFRPQGTLSGYAFMKMLLGALGYDAEIEGYVGANWSVNVAKQALGIDLDEGYAETFNGTKAVTREEACQLVFNALTSNMVNYESKTTVNVNNATVTIGSGKAHNVTTASNKSYDGNNDGIVQFCEKYFSDLTVKDTSDDFGRPAEKWSYKNDEVGVYSETPTLVYTNEVKSKTIYKDLDDNDAYSINKIYADGNEINPVFTLSKNNNDKIGSKGVLTEVFVEDNDEIIVTMINTYVAQVQSEFDDGVLDIALVDDMKDDNLTTFFWNLDEDDFDNLDKYAEDDYVLITVAADEVKSIQKATVVNSTVSAYVDNESVTMDKEREYAATYTGAVAYSLKDTDYDFVIDTYGNVIYVDADTVAANGKYVYVTDFFSNSNYAKADTKAYAYFIDGSDEEITVDKINGDSVKGVVSAAPGWYSYTVKNNKYRLTEKASDDVTFASATQVIEDHKMNNVDAYATSATVFVIVNDDTVKTYTGIKTAPNVKVGTDGIVSVIKDDSYAKYVFIDVGSDGRVIGGGKTSNSEIFIYKNGYNKSGTSASEDKYYVYKVIVDGKVTTAKFTDEYDALTIGIITEVTYDSNGFISDFEYVTDADDDYSIFDTNGADMAYSNSVLSIGDKALYLADNVKIFVPTSDGSMETISAKSFVNKYSGKDMTIHTIEDDDVIYIFAV